MEPNSPLNRISVMATHPAVFLVRGIQVMLAADLAPLFGVTQKRINEQIRRNERRFPMDFGFRLSLKETANLRPHFEASSVGHGGHRHPPFVVTEYGVVMLANVLNSDRAIAMSVRVVREFIRLRTLARSDGSLRKKFQQLERAVKSRLIEQESQINELFDAVEKLVGGTDGVSPLKRIGFVP